MNDIAPENHPRCLFCSTPLVRKQHSDWNALSWQCPDHGMNWYPMQNFALRESADKAAR